MRQLRSAIRNPVVLSTALMLAGVALLYWHASADLEHTFDVLLEALGSAAFIAGVLGLSVDRWIKRELARNAFEATFDYILPKELKSELRTIYEQKFLCVRHDQSFELEHTDDPDLMSLWIRVRRDTRNITNLSHPCTPESVFDEWGHPGRPTEIIQGGYSCGKKRCEEFEKVDITPHDVAASLPKFKVRPRETYTAWVEARETRHVSDMYVQQLVPATHSPSITVKVPPDIDYEVLFTADAKVERPGPHCYEIPRTLLPGQVVLFRWWPRRVAEDGDESASGPVAMAATNGDPSPRAVRA